VVTPAAAVGAGSVRAGAVRVAPALGRAATFVAVLGALWGLWEGYRWLWITTGWTRPFAVSDITMPHIHKILDQLFHPAPARKRTIAARTHHSKVDYNLFEGTEVTGTPDVVLLRGQVLVEGDELVAEPGIGQFVKRARFGEELKPAPSPAVA